MKTRHPTMPRLSFFIFPPKNLERANKMIIFAPLIDK